MLFQVSSVLCPNRLMSTCMSTTHLAAATDRVPTAGFNLPFPPPRAALVLP